MPDLAALEVEIRTSDVTRARKELDGLTASGARAQRATEQLTQSSAAFGRVLGGVTAYLGVREVIALSDEYTKYNAQLKLATGSASAFAAAQDDVRRISKDAQADIGAVGTLYARITKSTEQLGLTQGKAAEITEVVSLALKASGASAAESGSAILQLSQAFASGVLRGEEFNAVNEAAPRLMQALADGIGQPVGALRKMAEQGQLTSQVLADALPRALEDVRKEAAQVQTIGGSFTTLRNSLVEFVGQQAQASGATRALAGSLEVLADNLNTLTAAAAGYATIRLAKPILEATKAASERASTIAAEIAAQRASLAVTAQATAAALAQAEAEAASTASKLAGLQATNAAIVGARAEAIAKLKATDALIAQSAAQIAAARSAGALSFALAVVREGEEALATAQARRSLLMSELAVLGRQQARVSAATTAATAAQTAATTALTGATATQTAAQRALVVASGAGATAAGLASRALAVLGGPIGAITTALGLGVTAWLAWGGAAEEGESQASRATERSTSDIISDLNQQIEKLKQRNALVAAGLPEVAKRGGEGADRLGKLQANINRLTSQKFAPGSAEELARQEILRVTLIQYGQLGAAIAGVDHEQAKLDERTNKAKVTDFLKKYRTDAEKLADALAEAKKELGALYTPEIEKRIRDSFANKLEKDKPDFLGFNLDAIQRELSLVSSAFAIAQQEIESQKQAGLISDRDYYAAKIALAQQAAGAEIANLRASSAILAAQGGTERQRLDNQGKIADNEARIATLTANTAAQVTILGREQGAALIAQKQQFIDAERAAQDYFDALIRGYDIDLATAGLGDKERDRFKGLLELEEQYNKKRQALERQRTDARLQGRFGPDQQRVYDEELDRINRFQTAATEAFDRYYTAREQKERSATVGATRALANYADEARRTADQVEQAFTRSFNGLEDALVDFVRTGKLSFGSLVDSILADLARIAIRQSITGPLSQALGSLFGSFVGGGTGGASSGAEIGGSGFQAPAGFKLATGTNYVPYDGFKAVLHEGEAVVPKKYNPAVGGAGSTVVNVRIENAPQGAQVSQGTNSRGETDVLIRFQEQLIGAVAGDIRSGQGPVSSALAANGMNRSAGLR